MTSTDKHILRQRCAVLVVSCDAYSDLWQPFFSLYHRFWQECPCDTYLLTNYAQPDFEDVKPLAIGEDVSWSDNVLAAIDALPHDYVLLFLEDLLLHSPVRADEVQSLMIWAIENDCNYLRFNPSTPPDKPYDDRIGIVSPGTLYRASVVLSLFKKDVLRTLLVKGENAWQFETFATIRSDVFDKFYSTYYDYFPVLNTVIKGVWEYGAYHAIRRLGIEPSLERRRLMNLKERTVWQGKLLRSRLFRFVPPSWRRSVKMALTGR